MNQVTHPERVLDDGSEPRSPDELMARLDALGISHVTHGHAPVFTVEQARQVRGEQPGGHCKNLFLRNKKGAMWLVTCHEDRQIDLKAFADSIGAGRLSFASPRRLMAYLGVIPGAVTPFAVVNDVGAHVKVVVDAFLLEHDPLHFHPLDNARTTSVSAEGLLRFLEAEGHVPQVVDLDAFAIER